MTERYRLTKPTSTRSASMLSRRSVVGLIGLGVAAITLQGCGDSATDPAEDAESSSAAVDFSSRFAAFEPADEPNGELSKVVWPDFVLAAGPEVKRLYEFQVVNGDLMRYMPCFCGCDKVDGHRNNRDCYIDRVDPDGTVVFDSMAPT